MRSGLQPHVAKPSTRHRGGDRGDAWGDAGETCAHLLLELLPLARGRDEVDDVHEDGVEDRLEMWARCGRDVGEIWARYMSDDVHEGGVEDRPAEGLQCDGDDLLLCAVSRLHLAYLSPISRLSLASISPLSRLYLPSISPLSRLQRDLAAPAHRARAAADLRGGG